MQATFDKGGLEVQSCNHLDTDFYIELFMQIKQTTLV